MERIAVYDTSHATDNIGDYIIMDAVWRELQTLFPDDFLVTVPTHDSVGKRSKEIINESTVGIVGGTNLLCSNWLWFRSWQMTLADILQVKSSPVLLGVGWLNYQRRTDPLTAWLMRRLLSKDRIHSVRDSYTENRLIAMGISNVLNTACPTMWELTDEHCARIPVRKAPAALVTLTAYRPNLSSDLRWLTSVRERYEKVYFWSQMYSDLDYARGLVGNSLELIPPNLKSFDDILDREDVDFIGTRLHGGIRALQKQRRALIIEVDNRATEIAKDTGLETVKRDDQDKVIRWIEKPAPVKISLPMENIRRWRDQFGSLERSLAASREGLGAASTPAAVHGS